MQTTCADSIPRTIHQTITEVNLVNNEWMTYRTSDGSRVIEFYFVDCGPPDGWRIYILSRIFYRFRNASPHATHRLHDHGETYDYICWAGHIATLEQAKAIAALWADATALYIRNGGSFDTIAARLQQ